MSTLTAEVLGAYREMQKDATEAQPPADRPVVVTMSEVEPTQVRWIWEGRIALGKLNVIAGEPGEGKSTLTMDVAARVTTGAVFPDGGSGVSGDMLLLSAEDGPSDTIAPRLNAAGADSSRVHLLQAIRNRDGDERHFDLSRDLEPLRFTIQQYKPKLVIIDPMNAYLGNTDTWKDSKVRAVLAPLQKMAEAEGCAIAGIMHLSKDAGRKALHRVIGSIGFTGTARLVMAVAVDPEDNERRFFMWVKSNVSRPAETLAFRIVEQRIEWEPGPVKGITADGVIGGFPTDPSESKDAKEFLEEMLADGQWVASKGLFTEAKANGIDVNTLQRAMRTSVLFGRRH